MRVSGMFFGYLWNVLWSIIGAEGFQNIISRDKMKYFIYVDPLDDFGAATVARERCTELGI